MSFVHLHLHTEYSLLDGECRIKELCAAVKAAGQDTVAITDHGVLYGVVDFYRECKKNEIKPIIGCEVYVAPRSLDSKEHPFDSEYTHLVLLVKNKTGYRNLMKIVSDSFTKGFYRKPRTDMASLNKYSDGLICLSGCLSGYIPRSLLRGEFSLARERAVELKKIYGEGNFFLELQRHGIEGQGEVNKGLLLLSEDLKIPVVATNDVHYLTRADSETHRLLMAIQYAKTIDEDVGMEGSNFYLKSSEEMEKLFADLPEALKNTSVIAEMCEFDFEFDKRFLPVFKHPPLYKSSTEYLRSLCREGFDKRFAGKNPDALTEYESRLTYELSVIEEMGFVDYYLIVWDFVAFAKSRSIPVGPGRGSGVGSLCAYVLGITDVDPLKYGLLFERFLNPERVSMPDFDIDFCDEKRGEVIDYVNHKYGSDHVAQIITFGTLACRQAVRDTGRALGMSYSQVDRICRLLPRFGNITIEQALEYSPELRRLYNTEPDTKELLDYSKTLIGRPRNSSTHATGVVITDRAITDYVPLATNDNVVVTQFTMNTIADLGLLKIDFLGLRFLTILDNAEKLVKKKIPDFLLENIPDNDDATYRLLSAGNSIGLFQLESSGMRSLLTRMKPNCFEDVISAISLYRPGPMQFIDLYLDNRAEPEKTSYPHPKLESILSGTHGCIIYQEQVMQIFRSLANFTYGRADIIRRAMSKKKGDELAAEKDGFISGSIRNGISREVAEGVFEMITRFAQYAFNKSHAAAYAVIAYRTAYLKTHHPREYMCSLLNSVTGYTPKIREYIEECSRLGIKVLPPDVNESGEHFEVYGDDIRFGLLTIKNVGSALTARIINERNEKKFENPEDFLLRTYINGNIRMFESLIRSGALDCFGIKRSRLLAVLPEVLDRIAKDRAGQAEGQLGFFDDIEDTMFVLKYPNIEEMPLAERLSDERSLTGLYLTGHPVDKYKDLLEKNSLLTVSQIIEGLEDGYIKEKQKVKALLLVTAKNIKSTKQGKSMSFVAAEDASGEAEIIIFPNVHEKIGDDINIDDILIFSALAEIKEAEDDESERELKLLLDTISSPDSFFQKAQADKELFLRVEESGSQELTNSLFAIKAHKGNIDVKIYFEKEKRLSIYKESGCDASGELISQLERILGKENVVLKQKSQKGKSQ